MSNRNLSEYIGYGAGFSALSLGAMAGFGEAAGLVVGGISTIMLTAMYFDEQNEE